jgi:hypothetical protein
LLDRGLGAKYREVPHRSEKRTHVRPRTRARARAISAEHRGTVRYSSVTHSFTSSRSTAEARFSAVPQPVLRGTRIRTSPRRS